MRVSGRFIVETPRERVDAPNTVTSQGLTLVARQLLAEPDYAAGLTYVALGDGTAIPTTADTQLGHELVRRQVTTRVASVSGSAVFVTYFPPAAVAGNAVRELGVFGHTTATATADSGVLFARSLLNVTLQGTDDLTVTYVVMVT